MSDHTLSICRVGLTTLCLSLLLVASGGVAGGQAGALFPEPFEVEHYLIHEDGDGGRFVSEPVVDTYGGSWIVSGRPDGSRLVVDLARRELTEVHPAKGAYWTVSFDRFAELQRRLSRAKGLAAPGSGEPAGGHSGLDPRAGQAPGGAPSAEGSGLGELVVTELAAGEGIARRLSDRSASPGAAGEPVALRPGVRRLRVAGPEDAPSAALEVWVEPSIRLTPAALQALAGLEGEILGSDDGKASAAATPGGYLATARSHAGGAFPVLTTRPVGRSPEGDPVGRVEDVVTRLERLERFPRELVEIPEGLRRIPHPLEAMVRFLEEERERDEVMSGRRRGASGG